MKNKLLCAVALVALVAGIASAQMGPPLGGGFIPPTKIGTGGGGGVSDGDKTDITVSGAGAIWVVDPGAITLAKMANLAASTIIGRAQGAGTGVPQALTSAQATEIINLATTSLKGLLPVLSNNSAQYFDGTGNWSTPPGAEVVQVETSTGTVSNVALNANTTVLKFTGASAVSLTGMTGGVDGRPITIINNTGSNLTFKHDQTSTSANRLYTVTAADQIIADDDTRELRYSTTDNRWHVRGGVAQNNCSAGQFFSSIGHPGVLTCTAEVGDVASVTFSGQGIKSGGTCTGGACTPELGEEAESLSTAGTYSNYALADPTTVIECAPNDVNIAIDSIANGYAGRRLTIIYNPSGAEPGCTVLDDGAAAGTAAYRINLVGDTTYTLTERKPLHLVYVDGATPRWQHVNQDTTGGGGITNSAGNNVVMKSNGTNAVASNITDDGTSVLINSDAQTVGRHSFKSRQHNTGWSWHTDMVDCGTTTGVDGLAYSVSGTGSSNAVNAFDVNSLMYCLSSTGTTTTGRASGLLTWGVSQERFALGGGVVEFEARVRTDTTICDGTTEICNYKVGFIDTSTATPTDGIYFEHDPLASATLWRIGACSNSVCTESATATTFAVSTTYKLEFVTNAGATSVDFFIDGANVGTIATNVPTGTTRLGSFGWNLIKSAGTTARRMYIDYLGWNQVLTTPR